MHVKRLMKFLHTMGAIGMMGAMACLIVMLIVAPPVSELAQYALMRKAMGAVASWIYLPSMAVTLVAGLLAIAFTRPFHNAGWAWAKAATGVLVFEWSFVGVIGPMQNEAVDAADVIAGKADAALLAASLSAEQSSLWIMLGVATFNVVFGIWRPKLTNLPD